MSIIVNSFISLIIMLATVYTWVIIISALLSFVNPDPYNPIVKLIRDLTEPVYYRVRKMFPFVIVSGFDLSPLVVLFALNILTSILSRLYIWV